MAPDPIRDVEPFPAWWVESGTSLWIDPSRAALFLLLAHRGTADGKLNAWRRRFHQLTAPHLDAR